MSSIFKIAGYNAKETGANSTRHLQGFLQLNTKCRMQMLKTKLTIREIHHEKRGGTPAEAAVYCKKDGDWTEGGVMQTGGRSSSVSMAVHIIQNQGENNPPPVR